MAPILNALKTTTRCLVISLGNQAPYYNTLHSAGHHALNAAVKHIRNQPAFTRLAWGKVKCLVSQGDNYTLIQSPTAMNVSGPFVKKAWDTFSQLHRDIEPTHLRMVIVYDEMERAFGRVKLIDWNRSARGHNGLKSINSSLPSTAANGHFYRLGIGIDRPVSRDPNVVSKYVLGPFTPERQEILDYEVGPEVARMLEGLTSVWQRFADIRTPSVFEALDRDRIEAKKSVIEEAGRAKKAAKKEAWKAKRTANQAENVKQEQIVDEMGDLGEK
ncbi:peptidyl-tRNA hydrolase [Xylariaceae sp. FL1019]|nr:peptidyl-tRNA hydrolase [Xylariaceae sp. FL1019]